MIYDVVLSVTEARGETDMTMVVVKMPGGVIEHVDASDLLWMREAFDDEFRNTVMLRLGGDRICSVEPLTYGRNSSRQERQLHASPHQRAILPCWSLPTKCGRS